MQTPATTATSGAYSRLGAVGEQRRPDPGAERGAADEAGERQRAGEQAALVADRGERDHEEDDADVDEAQRCAPLTHAELSSRRAHYLFPHDHRVAAG